MNSGREVQYFFIVLSAFFRLHRGELWSRAWAPFCVLMSLNRRVPAERGRVARPKPISFMIQSIYSPRHSSVLLLPLCGFRFAYISLALDIFFVLRRLVSWKPPSLHLKSHLDQCVQRHFTTVLRAQVALHNNKEVQTFQPKFSYKHDNESVCAPLPDPICHTESELKD